MLNQPFEPQPPFAMAQSRPCKRRKVVGPLHSSDNAISREPRKPVATSTTVPTCISCHRGLNATKGLIVCARCSSLTCAICSRTCTACPTSMPPTPYLTRSHTPSESPRRYALSLHSVNTNFGDTQRVSGGEKRRKGTEEEKDYSLENWIDTLGEHDMTPGCGRTLCRGCCMENIESASTTCYDCAGRY